MTSKLTHLTIILTLFVVHTFLHAQVPEGGIQLNATSGTTFQRIGSGNLTQVTVEDQPFTTALRMEVGANINNAWDSQIRFPAAAGIEKDDVVLVTFYARTISSIQETGQASAIVVIENNSTYDKEIYFKMDFGVEWRQYFAPVQINSTLTTSQVTYALFTGFPSQTIEFADVRFLNYKQTLTLEDMPVTEITYIGQDPEAAWRGPAQERINLYRKGVAEITVYDENGNPVENAGVSVKMIRHKFGFGSAIPASRFMTNETFRNKVYELFNEVVYENDLKWGSFNSTSMLNISRSLDSLDNYNIEVRGHNVIWPAWRWIPTAVRTLENDPEALRTEIERRIDQVTTFTKGRLNDWDVINEPYSEKDIMAILGNEVMVDWFKRVRHNDPGVKLYLNDYGILSGGGINQVKQDYYYNLVKYIDDLGGEVDGIGFQGHFGGDLTPITRIYNIIERFAELGKDIKITENDINITQRQVQADYTRDFLTIVFSHPAVKSNLFWGFWENSHWMPDAALFNADWTIRPHGEAYIDLVFNQWWTPEVEEITNDLGIVSFEGFLGTYEYTVKTGETERTGIFNLDHSNFSDNPNQITISLDEEIPVQFRITADRSPHLCQGEAITLIAPAGEGLEYKWYRGEELLSDQKESIETDVAGNYKVVVSKGPVEITSPYYDVVVNPIPEAIITVDGDLSFCPGGSVNLIANASDDLVYTWYRNDIKFRGSVTSIKATTTGTYTLVTGARGCNATSEPVYVEVLSTTDPECSTGIFDNPDGLRVYPNPFKGSFNLESYHSSPLTIELYNTAGQIVYTTQTDPSEAQTIIPVAIPGFYMLKISGSEGVRTVRVVGR
jgi:endo-1,4-beta-xylanase